MRTSSYVRYRINCIGDYFMSNCKKHRYKYAFSTKLTEHDLKLLKLGYFKSIKKNNLVGESVSFYECVDCGEMIAMGLL